MKSGGTTVLTVASPLVEQEQPEPRPVLGPGEQIAERPGRPALPVQPHRRVARADGLPELLGQVVGIATAGRRLEHDAQHLEVHVVVVVPPARLLHGRDVVDDVARIRAQGQVGGVGVRLLVLAHRLQARVHLEQVPQRDPFAGVVPPGRDPFGRRLVDRGDLPFPHRDADQEGRHGLGHGRRVGPVAGLVAVPVPVQDDAALVDDQQGGGVLRFGQLHRLGERVGGDALRDGERDGMLRRRARPPWAGTRRRRGCCSPGGSASGRCTSTRRRRRCRWRRRPAGRGRPGSGRYA